MLHGVAAIDEKLRAPYRQKSVLFDTQLSRPIEASTVPGKLCVSITKPDIKVRPRPWKTRTLHPC